MHVVKTETMSEVADVEQYVSQLKVVELREELKKRHLPYAGNKKDLAQRLQESMLKEKEQLGPEDGTTTEMTAVGAQVFYDKLRKSFSPCFVVANNLRIEI